jgi:hypothetical protein
LVAGLEDCTVEVLGGDRIIARVNCTMSATVADIVDTIESLEAAAPGTKTTRLKQISPGLSLLLINLTIPIVRNRDFVVCQNVTHRAAPTAHIVVTSLPGEQAQKVHAESDKIVRGRIIMQSTAVTPLPGGRTHMKWISCVDLEGICVAMAVVLVIHLHIIATAC